MEKWETDSAYWRLAAPFAFYIDGELHVIPFGFMTDFASVPRLPLAYLIAGGRAEISATIHDWLYKSQAGKDFADQVFRDAMETEGVGAFVRAAMYRAVRMFGASAYDNENTK